MDDAPLVGSRSHEAVFVFFLFLVLSGFAGPGFAAEPEKDTQIDSLTSFQLGDYTLKFEGESPRKPNSLDNPPGLKSYERTISIRFLA